MEKPTPPESAVITVLLVEDNPDWLDWLETDTRKVIGPDIVVLTANNQKEAEDQLRQHGGELSLVVLDLYLPRRVEVGLGILQRIRSGEWGCPDVPVLCTSTATDSGTSVQATLQELKAVFVPRSDRRPRARFREALTALWEQR